MERAAKTKCNYPIQTLVSLVSGSDLFYSFFFFLIVVARLCSILIKLFKKKKKKSSRSQYIIYTYVLEGFGKINRKVV